MNNSRPVVLAMFANAKGFGYVCIENEHKLLDYGIANVRPLCNGKILKRMIGYIDYYRPTVVILQDPKRHHARHGMRIQSLIDNVVQEAQKTGLQVYQYSRAQVRESFAVWGCVSKHEIAQQLLIWHPILHSIAPQARKLWQKEDYHMGIFDALALLVTHCHITK